MGGADDDVAISHGCHEAGKYLAAVENIVRTVGKGRALPAYPTSRD